MLWILLGQVNSDVVVKSERNRTVRTCRDQPASHSFGVHFPKDGLWGHLFYVEPDDGCKPFRRPVAGSDWIAVISMSEQCRFEDQVYNAQGAGFIAAIVHNNESDDLVEMTNATHFLSIPSTFIGLSNSHYLAQFDKRLNVSIVIIEYESSDTEEILLIILAAVSSFSAIIVLGIVIGIGVHRCCRSRAQLLSRWKLKRLPLHIFKKGDIYENCAICLEEYNEGDKLRILPCAHAFHSKCIDVWLTKNRKTCPLCNETVNPSRRRKSRADSERDRDSERRPLLMPVSNDNNSEPEENAESSRNQSSVEIHEEPSSRLSGGHRNYGTAGMLEILSTSESSDLDGSGDDDSLPPVEYVSTFGRSPLCHIRAEQDAAVPRPSSEVQALSQRSSAGANPEYLKPEFGTEEFQKPEVFVSKNNPAAHDEDQIV